MRHEKRRAACCTCRLLPWCGLEGLAGAQEVTLHSCSGHGPSRESVLPARQELRTPTEKAGRGNGTELIPKLYLYWYFCADSCGLAFCLAYCYMQCCFSHQSAASRRHLRLLSPAR